MTPVAIRLVATLAMPCACLIVTTGAASAQGCQSNASLETAATTCGPTATDATATIATSPPRYRYKTAPLCLEDRTEHSGSCLRIQPCLSAENGIMHNLWRQDTTSGEGREQAASVTTSSPGAPYPDLTVTHAYRYAPATVHPWVDTTYAGRYRLDGGAWQDIPGSLTVPGEPQALQVVEAEAKLVDADG